MYKDQKGMKRWCSTCSVYGYKTTLQQPREALDFLSHCQLMSIESQRVIFTTTKDPVPNWVKPETFRTATQFAHNIR